MDHLLSKEKEQTKYTNLVCEKSFCLVLRDKTLKKLFFENRITEDRHDLSRIVGKRK